MQKGNVNRQNDLTPCLLFKNLAVKDDGGLGEFQWVVPLGPL